MIALVVAGYVVLGIGVLLFLLTVVKKLGDSESSRIKIFEVEVSLPGSLLLTVLGGALAVIGTFGPAFTEPPTPAPAPAGSPTNSPSSVTELTTTALPHMAVGAFSSPIDGQEVSGRTLSVRGSVEGLSSMSLLCIVKTEFPAYFINEAEVEVNGQWSAQVGIGPASLVPPVEFTLILATATQSTASKLRSLREINPSDFDANGLPELLPGIEPLAEIVVVRTS